MKTLLIFAGSISTLVGFWLVSVLVVIAPRHSVGPISFWSVTTIGFFVFGVFTILHARNANTSWIRVLLIPLASIAVLFGIFLLVLNELAFRNNGDWEGYFVLMSLILIGNGTILLAHLFRTRSKTLQTV